MRSGAGKLVILSGDDLPINTILTDPQYTGHPFIDLRIQDGYVCEIHGYTAILLYSRLVSRPTPLEEPVKETTQKLRDHTASTLQINNLLRSPFTALAPEILIRIQLTPSGKFSPPYHKDVMRPKVSTTEFFTWFYNEVSRTGVPFNSGSDVPGPTQLNQLSFTLKDAMPIPRTGFLTRGDEIQFMYMQKYIMEQYEKARAFCPGLREFVILFKVPGTVDADVAGGEW